MGKSIKRECKFSMRKCMCMCAELLKHSIKLIDCGLVCKNFLTLSLMRSDWLQFPIFAAFWMPKICVYQPTLEKRHFRILSIWLFEIPKSTNNPRHSEFRFVVSCRNGTKRNRAKSWLHTILYMFKLRIINV